MYQQQVIAQLLAWIEANLDQPLTLDDIAAKSGYSKWHLQRLFKQLTGHILGTYARRRRLTAAARELRLTHTGVACIADKYQFDSQQTFTRCFKNSSVCRRPAIAAARIGPATACSRRCGWQKAHCLRGVLSLCRPCSWWGVPSAAAALWGKCNIRK